MAGQTSWRTALPAAAAVRRGSGPSLCCCRLACMSTLRIAAVIPARLGFDAAGAQGAAPDCRAAHGGVGVARGQCQRADGSGGGGDRFGGSGGGLPGARDSRGDDLAELRRAGRTGCGKLPRQIDADIYVNIQGDEPTLTPDFFPPLLELFERPEVEVATLAVRCPPEEFANPNAVKVVTALDGRALYFSRATIPFDRDADLGLPAIASIWEFMPTAKRRWSGLRRCRPRRWRNWSGWSSCGCSKMALRSMWRTRRETRLAWIRKRIWRGRRRCLEGRCGAEKQEQ